MTLFNLPGLFIILVGVLMDRFGARRAGTTFLGVLTIGTVIVASSATFIIALGGRLIGGVGAASIGVIAPAVISQWFDRDELGRAMGVYATGLPIATVVAFNVVGQLGIANGWRTSFLVQIPIDVVVLGLFWKLVRNEPPIASGTEADKMRKRGSGQKPVLRIVYEIPRCGRSPYTSS
ncbi:MAG: MFS transporter [Nitrososphaerota archaeon]|jgi:MFS family permease|nr:MFS transporter [Nitrososphaerota archaeon]MDG7039108.1 MFS transporter [Nitrososphaerota archaeon]MDG7042665.1 MFS transporter [Nitrososphaerota archaeon]